MNNDWDNAKPARPAASLDRLPPHSEEGERGVLGCCLLDAECIDDVRARLTEESFYDLRHRNIWSAMLAVYEKLKGLDMIALQAHCRDLGQLDQVGGLAYVSELPDAVPSAANIAHYINLVADKELLRRVLRTCSEAVASVYEPGEKTARDIAASAEKAILTATETRDVLRERHIKELLIDATENVLNKFQRGVKMNFGPTLGFNYLDSMIPGMHEGGYFVLAARPSVGKSSLMLQICEHVSLVCKQPVHVFSLEMTGRSLALREVFQKAGASFMKFTDGFLIDADIKSLTVAASRLAKAPWTVDDCSRATIDDIEVRARRLHRKYGVRVFFIDYLQLLSSRSKRWNNRNDEMADISTRLVALAKELNVTFFVLAQMNRESEKEPHRIPRLSDLRDTGQVEQDADVVMFLYRPKFDPDVPEEMKWLELAPEGPPDNLGEWKSTANWHRHYGRINCYVAKQRNGPTGDAQLTFVKDWVRFVDTFRPAKTE